MRRSRAVPAGAALAFARRLCVFVLSALWLAVCARKPVPRRATPLTDALLQLARSAGGSPDDDTFARAELDHIAQRVRRARAAQPQRLPSLVLRRVVFERLGFTREVQDRSMRYVLLPAVLHNRRGSCVGLGSLYLALAERLGLSMHGVIVPGHFFVRIREQAQTHNLELLHAGEQTLDDFYRTRWPIPGGRAREYGRPLTTDEVLGVVEFDLGNAYKRAGKLNQAARAYERARAHFPDFAEAHASAGAVAQLLGALDRAQDAYQAARAANPNLPGVGHNLELLQAERERVEARGLSTGVSAMPTNPSGNSP